MFTTWQTYSRHGKKPTLAMKQHFYNFMTTPSLERDEFVASMPKEEAFVGNVVAVTIKVP